MKSSRSEPMSKSHGDPRPGIKSATPGSTIEKFSMNPFRDGGAQEQPDVSAGKEAKGPSIKRAPKPDMVDDPVDRGEIKGSYGG
jgi:hypothetical protein